MTHCAGGPVPAVIVYPDVSVRPANHASRDVIRIHKEDWIIVDHFVNAAIPGGDVNDAVPICAQTGHRHSAAHRWPVLPSRSIPFEKAVLRAGDPDVALDVREHSVHLVERVVQYPGSAVEFRHSAESRVRQPHVIVSADDYGVHVVPWRGPR